MAAGAFNAFIALLEAHTDGGCFVRCSALVLPAPVNGCSSIALYWPGCCQAWRGLCD